MGGGTNHRFNLSDEYLIKDNHIASSDLKSLVQKAIKNKKGKKITLPKILDCLENETGEIIMDKETIDKARISVERMAAIGR